MTPAQRMLAYASEKACEFFHTAGQIAPMYDIETKDGQHLLVLAPWKDEEDKDRVTHIIRGILREHQALRYAFISEAWTVAARAEDALGAKLAFALAAVGRLADHDDRMEVLMISVEDRGGERISREYRILRSEHGKPTLAPPREIDMSTSIGSMVGLFDEEA